MTQYRITSDRLTLGKQGETISDEKLDGLNIDALLEGGHLEPVTNSKTKTNDNTEEK